MESLNDEQNPIYINALQRTLNIDRQLNKSRIHGLNTDCVIGGPKNDILLFMKGGPAKNLVCSFFKYTTDKCDYCGIKKDKTIQLDRAHCNKALCDRSSLLAKSIDIHFIDVDTPIKIKDILKTFIKLHEKIPLFILCKKCHREYDN
jgi:hypothetical protein